MAPYWCLFSADCSRENPRLPISSWQPFNKPIKQKWKGNWFQRGTRGRRNRVCPSVLRSPKPQIILAARMQTGSRAQSQRWRATPSARPGRWEMTAPGEAKWPQPSGLCRKGHFLRLQYPRWDGAVQWVRETVLWAPGFKRHRSPCKKKSSNNLLQDSPVITSHLHVQLLLLSYYCHLHNTDCKIYLFLLLI